MLGQTFEVSDIARLFALILIELMLSADNALILAAMVHPLPVNLRKKALFIGAFSAFVLRGLAIVAVSFILKSFWLKVVGAAYLIYLCLHHFFKKDTVVANKTYTSFWKTIVMIELMDLTFAMDSIIAGIAFIATPGAENGSLLHPKIWIVYVGGISGLLMIRYAASLFIKLIDKYPGLSTSAYLLVGWVGIKLFLSILLPSIPFFVLIFWTVFALIIGIGFLPKQTKPPEG